MSRNCFTCTTMGAGYIQDNMETAQQCVKLIENRQKKRDSFNLNFQDKVQSFWWAPSGAYLAVKLCLQCIFVYSVALFAV